LPTVQKVKNTIPVYDICSLNTAMHIHEDIIAEHFAAYLEQHKNLKFPHRHSFYHLVLFTEGEGNHTIDFEEFAVQPRQIYFMVPGQVHSWHFEGHVDGVIINFSERIFNNFQGMGSYLEQFIFFRGIAKDSVIELSAAAMEIMKATAHNIVEEVAAKRPFGADMICACLQMLLITASRETNEGVKGAIAQPNLLLMHHFKKLVDQYYTEKRLPKDYAALLYITPNHLNALCNDLLGIAAGAVIRDRILLEAKRLLVNGGMSIAEIAFQLNFTDNSHLTKFFKKHTGVSPEEFRKSSTLKA
jgi:AraC family transcriptional activator of pobA